MNLLIPFTYLDRQGEVEVIYERNNNAVDSGMDLFDGMGFDVDVCIGYPTMHARIKNFAGTGYRMTMGWIQIIEYKMYSRFSNNEPDKVVTQIDNYPYMREKTPFCSLGVLPQLYDAPSSANVEGEKVEFTAHTFLVTLPAPFADNSVSNIISFKWGYIENNSLEKRTVEIKPIEVTDSTAWESCVEILKKEYKDYHFI